MRDITTYQTMSCTPDNLPAIYERDITNIYLQYFTGDEDTLLSFADIDRLFEIASKCPIVNGNAVYDAIALLNTFYPELQYNVIENCLNNGLRLDDEKFESIQLIDSILIIKTIIYPNPTNGTFTIINSNNESILFRLYDITGRIISILSIGANTKLEINILSQLPDGIYYYQTIGSVNFNGKIVKFN
jgi:hypothetical protein